MLHGTAGVGKTSFAANAPRPIFVMTESGLETLNDSGQIGDVPHFPMSTSWTETMSMLDWLLTQPHEYGTVVIDTANGVERQCHDFVCDRDYKGDWSEKGFLSYKAGFETALTDWRQFLAMIDRLGEQRNMAAILLCHTSVSPFSNPEGANYDRYTPAMHRKTWDLTNGWADIVLFANFHTEVVKEGGKAKGRGGQIRVLHTTRHAAFDSKNRHGLSDEVEMGNSGKEAWDNFLVALKAGKEVK